ncbi:hypothetical protein AFM11_34345 [Mycolicibacterium wolinskyi]|uniref:Uncharacterized protein n=1 Tax=Mycolicibacterium wolinskyi TaxID=59750 RepID=A0A132PBL4_9MYCO|nr:hypothetical protein [Mycolicibacterium wolinskyi]KWX19725.1 hypothetical protein AFM11_34345 [Mycolicibacterium wolinskyi]
MSRLGAVEQAARKERYAAIRRCRYCDPVGWRLQPDGEPIDPAVRCTHSPPAPVRDITEPIHQPDLFSEPDR